MTVTASQSAPGRRLTEREPASIVWGTHATYGPYIAAIRSNGLTFPCEPCAVFGAIFDRASDGATIVAVPSDFTVVRSGNTITATWKTDTRIVFTLSVAVSGVELLFSQAMNSTSTTYSVQTFDWPLYQPKVIGNGDNCFAYVGAQGGAVYRRPQDQSGGAALVAPLSMQHASMYDSASRAQLYMATDDVEGCRKVIFYQGLTTSVRWGVRHEVDRRYVPGSDFNRPYKLHVKGLVGKTRDGRLGYYDTADEYRTWATNASRPWMSRGVWRSSSAVSSRVKNADFSIWWPSDGTIRDFPRKTNIVSRLMSFCGMSEMLATVYWWVQQAFNAPAIDNPSIGTMQSDYLTFLASAQALGCHVQDYVNHRFLDSQLLSGPFNMSAYAVTGLGTIDVRTRCLRSRTGALSLAAGDVSEGTVMMQPDYARSDWTLIAYQILLDYAVAHAGAGSAGPRGIYYDSFGANLSDYQDDPAQTSWTYRANQAGRKNVISTILSGFRGVDPSFFMSQEYPEEMLIDVFDLVYTQTIQMELNGKFVDTFSYVYGEYVRTAQYLTPQITDPGNAAANLPYVQNLDASWLRSGIASIDDATISSQGELIAASPTPVNTPLYYLWDWIKKLHAARTRTLPYFQGKRMRPLSLNTWEGDWLESSETAFQQFWVGVQTNNVVQSGVFKAADGALGIIVVHEYPAGVFGDPGPQTRKLEIDSTTYELASGENVLYERTDSGLTELVRFVNEISYDITMQSGTIRTFEVRAAT